MNTGLEKYTVEGTVEFPGLEHRDVERLTASAASTLQTRGAHTVSSTQGDTATWTIDLYASSEEAARSAFRIEVTRAYVPALTIIKSTRVKPTAKTVSATPPKFVL